MICRKSPTFPSRISTVYFLTFGIISFGRFSFEIDSLSLKASMISALICQANKKNEFCLNYADSSTPLESTCSPVRQELAVVINHVFLKGRDCL